MSRDKKLNRTQEVIGSIPFSSTNFKTSRDRKRSRFVFLRASMVCR